MSLSFRTIGKFGFLLVFFGFFMPMACDMNGFDWAASSMASTELSLALYGLFISAIAGIIVGVVLLMKKTIPVSVDWSVLIACLCFGLIPFFVNINYIEFYQIGVYVMLAGGIFAFVFQLISYGEKNQSVPICITIPPNSTAIEAHAFQGKQLTSSL